jgi:hypothetical protein
MIFRRSNLFPLAAQFRVGAMVNANQMPSLPAYIPRTK